MKLRIQGNSIRLRLKEPEVEAFATRGSVEDAALIAPGQRLAYGLLAVDAGEIATSFDSGTLTVTVPRDLARDWTDTERVGFEAELDAGDGERLKILVEKDFRCLHQRPGEDESENYPHPREQ